MLLQEIHSSSAAAQVGAQIRGFVLEDPRPRPDYRPDWEQLHLQWRGRERDEVRGHPRVECYNAFYRGIGLNPNRNPPAAANLVQRFLLGPELTRIPQIHPFVDAGNVAAAETLIPVAVFDADCIAGQMRLDMAKEGETFLGFGMQHPEPLAPNTVVLRDDEKVLSIFCLRDGQAQSVQPHTRRIWILAAQVPGIRAESVDETLRRVEQLLS